MTLRAVPAWSSPMVTTAGSKGETSRAHDGLERVGYLGGDHHGVGAALRHGAVAGGAAHVDAEPIDVGHARARLARDEAGVDLAPYVHGKGAVDTVCRAGVDHRRRAPAVFLRGLEDGADLAVERVGHLREHAEGAQKHRGVAVVPAGVHDAGVLAGKRLSRLLGDGQGVYVGPHEEAPPGSPGRVVGVGGRPAEAWR